MSCIPREVTLIEAKVTEVMVAAEVITITVTLTTIMAITETEIIIAIKEAVATQ